MQARDRYILIGLAGVAIIAAFWFMAISPQRQKASELDAEIDTVRASIDEYEQTAAFAEQARQDFPRYYGKLVVLGKAVPENADTASMLVELNRIAARENVGFRTIKLSPGGAASAPTPTPTPAPAPPTDGSTASTDGAAPADASTASSDPAAASADPAAAAAANPVPTEATAAALPIGSAIGPAGLPTLPYSASFRGRFFDMADFFNGLDGLIKANSKKVAADGRLITIDGFAFFADEKVGFPMLEANVAITTYSTPASQGLTGGATPTAPAPTVPPATPVSDPTSAGVTP